ncbi:MAG: terminase small subunit [Planctomycetota bacterium]|jgi:phage terminase small subunit
MGKNQDNKLTPPQLKFCQLLTCDPSQNATQAYLGAYPSCKKPETAKAAASRLLTNVNVKGFIDKHNEKSMAKYELTADRVNKEKAAIAYFKIGDIFHPSGQLKAPHEMDEATQSAISSIEIEAKAKGSGDDREVVLISKVKVHNKVAILDQCTKQLGGYEKDNAQKGTTMADLINAVDGKTRGLPPPEPEEE